MSIVSKRCTAVGDLSRLDRSFTGTIFCGILPTEIEYLIYSFNGEVPPYDLKHLCRNVFLGFRRQCIDNTLARYASLHFKAYVSQHEHEDAFTMEEEEDMPNQERLDGLSKEIDRINKDYCKYDNYLKFYDFTNHKNVLTYPMKQLEKIAPIREFLFGCDFDNKKVGNRPLWKYYDEVEKEPFKRFQRYYLYTNAYDGSAYHPDDEVEMDRDYREEIIDDLSYEKLYSDMRYYEDLNYEYGLPKEYQNRVRRGLQEIEYTYFGNHEDADEDEEDEGLSKGFSRRVFEIMGFDYDEDKNPYENREVLEKVLYPNMKSNAEISRRLFPNQDDNEVAEFGYDM